MPTLNTTPNRGYEEPASGNDLATDVARITAAIRAIDTDVADAFSQIVAKANLASPTFTGVPTAPTAAPGTDTAQIASTAFVRAAVVALIDSSPGALDTLNELAAALGDDPNFAATITALIGTKADAAATTAALAGKQNIADRGILSGHRNKLLNGDFYWWQAATLSLAIAAGASAFVFDLWYVTNNTNQTVTVSQQAHTLGQTAVPGNPKYKLRAAFSSAPTTGTLRIAQRIEGVETLSGLDASARGHFTGPSGSEVLACEVVQNFGTGGSPSGAVTTAAASLDIATIYSASTQVRKAGFAVPSIAAKVLGSNLNDYTELAWVLTPRQSGNYEVSRLSFVQGDASSEIDPFSPRGHTDELCMIQRHVWELSNPPITGLVFSGIGAVLSMPTKVTMRRAPDIVIVANIGIYDGAGGDTQITGAGTNQSGTDTVRFVPAASGGAGLPTAGRPVILNPGIPGRMRLDARL